MSYVATTDATFRETLESWFQTSSEILVLIRYSHAAGNKSFEFFLSFDVMSKRIDELPVLTCITAFIQPQLPIRGVVDEGFISKCLSCTPDGEEYLVVETVRRVYGKHSFFHYGAGQSHAELREELDECRGNPVAVGLYPPWLKDMRKPFSESPQT